MTAPHGEECQPTAMCNARDLSESSASSASVLPIQPRTILSIALVPWCIGFTSAPCSPHVGPSVSQPVISLAARRSGEARSFMEPDGISSPTRLLLAMPAFSHSLATPEHAARKSEARVADVLSMAQLRSSRSIAMAEHEGRQLCAVRARAVRVHGKVAGSAAVGNDVLAHMQLREDAHLRANA
eukprot:7379344-Prymnesium_polylepis.2